MRILTLNIWNYSGNWKIRRHSLIETIRDAEADVIALQEVRHNWNDLPGRNQAKWLAEQTGHLWVYRPANIFVHMPPVTEGLAFLTKRPLPSVDWTVVPKRGRGPRRIILSALAGSTRLLNVHYPLSREGRTIASDCLLACAAKTGFGEPVILLGDFNADADEAAIQLLLRAGFQDLWASLPATRSGAKAWPDRRRIDYIFGRDVPLDRGTIQSIGVSADPITGLKPSDHFGILVDLPAIG